MPVLRKVPEKLFVKTVISKGYGYHTPQDGSVCIIKVISDEAGLLTGLDDNNCKEIVIGDVDESVDRIIEDCIRTMKEEEICVMKFKHPDLCSESIIQMELCEENSVTSGDGSVSLGNGVETNGDTSLSVVNGYHDLNISSENHVPMQTDESTNASKTNGDADVPNLESTQTPLEEVDNSSLSPSIVQNNSTNEVKIQFQLLTYIREPEIWEMSITEKWRRASYHKQKGLELYARGAYQYAFRRFGLTLKYLISLEHDVPSGQEEGMDIKGLKLSCYLNVAACQMRHHNFESVVINATKALEIQPNNAKALYRRGAAYLELQEYEKSKEDLTAAAQIEPKNQAIANQLQVLKCKVQKLNQYYASVMKKMFI